MMFTKIKKPLFKDPHPTLNDFQERRLALEYFGIDASAITSIANNFSLLEHQGAAYAGIRANPIIQKIANIINIDLNKNQSRDLTGKVARIDQRDDIVKLAFGLYNLHAVSGRVLSADPGIPVELTNLTRRQVNRIKNELKKINRGDYSGNKGETLTVDNFDSFRDKLFKEVLSGQYNEFMNMILGNARKLGIQVDAGSRDSLDMDSPIGVARIEGLERFEGKEEYAWAFKWQQIRDIFEGAGFIKEIKGVDPIQAENLDINKIKDIEGSIKQMTETLRIENYGESVDVFIDPVDNGFIEALSLYKFTKNLSSAYNIIEGVRKFQKDFIMF